MKEPFCALCGRNKNSGIADFKETEAGRESKRRKWNGHPPDGFCEDHISVARRYIHLMITEAPKDMKK
ncbi:MAG: hypothetical protein U0R44_00220 [Candidatus Micrarchaeia archaeon]